jgi:FixJ family two-component response regulator
LTHEPLISIVDDDEGVRASLDGLVRSLGYRVALFESAEDFIAAMPSVNSQCVISDIEMPGGMNGISLLKHLRSSGLSIPVILISAFLDKQLVNQALAAGASCLLDKPFDGDRLISQLHQAIGE